jgi:general secretion pathway protein C
MFFRVAVVSLLSFLALRNPVSPQVPVVIAAPPAPMVVVVPSAAASTQVVDIRRADLERALQEPAHDARIVPAVHHGAFSGVKLYAIRPGSPLATIGLQNGDTVHAINDVPVTSADAALALYQRRRALDHVDLDLERRGERMRILVMLH